MLSILIFLPIVAMFILMFLPSSLKHQYKYINLGIVIIQMAFAIMLYNNYNFVSSGLTDISSFQFVEKYDWIALSLGAIGKLQIQYFVGVDGLNFSLVMLSIFVMFIASISSFEIKDNQKAYYALLLLLNASVIGVFVALDFFLFFIFYELMLLPLYFLIGIWGGERREYASIKFFIYTLFGSVFMLLVIVGLYLSVVDPKTGVHTFDILLMSNPENYIKGSLFDISANREIFGVSARLIAFLVTFIAFAIKIPIVPLHTWLPDAHVEAPTPISIILAGVLLKVGGYGILRICFGIFPDMAVYTAQLLAGIGVLSIIYGALNALAAKDLKRLIAYSSVSHMGFVLLGISSITVEGVSGALFQMVSHGILSSMLFFIVGVIYNRVHNRYIYNFRGLYTQMPRFSVYVFAAFFASLGLPGFSAFIAEVFVLIGAFNSAEINGLVPKYMAVIACLGIVLGASYLLWTIQRMFFGVPTFKESNWSNLLTDINKREEFALLSMISLALILGIFPNIFFDATNQSIIYFVDFILNK